MPAFLGAEIDKHTTYTPTTAIDFESPRYKPSSVSYQQPSHRAIGRRIQSANAQWGYYAVLTKDAKNMGRYLLLGSSDPPLLALYIVFTTRNDHDYNNIHILEYSDQSAMPTYLNTFATVPPPD
jgi:hypothetical protein